MKYFIANWKANKNLQEAYDWFDRIFRQKPWSDQNRVIICPPFPLIYPLREKIKNTNNIFLGAQDVSSLESGSFTGEVTAKSCQGLIDYVIIGHSERRKLFAETNETVSAKIRLAKKYNIEPVVCVRNKADMVAEDAKFTAYEPVEAIGTGQNESLTDILSVKKSLDLKEDISFFYGGSVNPQNIKQYLESDEIRGFLVGTASLDPLEFYNLLT